MAAKAEPIDLDSKQVFDKLFAEIDFVVSDCDGVLWIDDLGIEGSAHALNNFRKIGKQIIFVTNNDTKTRKEFCDKMIKLGFVANVCEIYPTSYLIAKYLKERDFDKKVYIFGTDGIADELREFGIQSIIDNSVDNCDQLPDVSSFDADVGAVAVGTNYNISFQKCVIASTYIKQKDCLFVATSYDEKCPNPQLTVPGPGAMLALIESATATKAVTLGKPSTLFFEVIKTDYPNIDPNRCLMIGDRLVTDIPFGHNNHMKTLFVETGINSRKDMIEFVESTQRSDQLFVPNYYIKALNDLNKYF